jgi:hypothetical protein
MPMIDRGQRTGYNPRLLSANYLVLRINYCHNNQAAKHALAKDGITIRNIERFRMRQPESIRARLKIQVSKDLEIYGEAPETCRSIRGRQSWINTPDRFKQLTARLRQREPPVTSGTRVERNQPAFEQRVEFGAIHVDLLRRMAEQHQRGNFMWT